MTAAGSGAFWLSAEKLAAWEALDATEAARLAMLLPLYNDDSAAARFEQREKSGLASCSRVLQRLHLYPRLQKARRVRACKT
jgi:hypothetical protein